MSARPKTLPPHLPRRSLKIRAPSGSDHFYNGVGATSDYLTRFDGAATAGIIGLVLGTAAGNVLSGPGLGMVAGIGGGIAGAIGGYQGGKALSDFGGNLGRDLDTGDAVRGEALGRLGVQMVLGGLTGGVPGALGSAVLPGIGGVINYALN